MAFGTNLDHDDNLLPSTYEVQEENCKSTVLRCIWPSSAFDSPIIYALWEDKSEKFWDSLELTIYLTRLCLKNTQYILHLTAWVYLVPFVNMSKEVACYLGHKDASEACLYNFIISEKSKALVHYLWKKMTYKINKSHVLQ